MALRGSHSCQQEQKCPEFKASGSRNRRERTKRRSPGPHLFIFIASMCSAQSIGSGWWCFWKRKILPSNKRSLWLSKKVQKDMNLRNSRPLEVPIRWLARGVGICPLPPSLVSQGLQPPPPPRQPPSLARGSREKSHEGTGQVKATPWFWANWFVCWIFQDVHTALINLCTFF